MENFFKLKEHGTDVKTEVIAGLTTFMTMAYILAVNPSILGATGMDTGAIFTATALASAIGSFCMALFANLPFVLSAGMGLNAYFAYTVVLGMGYSWEVALTAVFVEGIIFIILSLTNVREAIFNAIPASLKVAVSVGIGLFITFIGLQNAHIVVDGSTLVGLFSFNGSVKAGTFQSEGITVVLALIGLLITAFLVIKNVKGNILLGILITWVLGIICQLTGLYVPNAEAGFYSLIPSGIISAPASVAPTLFKMDFSAIASLNFVVVVFAFLFVDIFDTLGTLIGCATKANMLDKEGKLPGIKGALMADAVGTVVGACLGTSTVTSYVESSAGVAAGGRTGLTAVTTAVLFFISLIFAPIFTSIPSFATTPAMLYVGLLMLSSIRQVKFDGDIADAIGAFLAIIMMPLTYSIANGIMFGIVSWVILKLVTGKAKDISAVMWISVVLFAIYIGLKAAGLA